MRANPPPVGRPPEISDAVRITTSIHARDHAIVMHLIGDGVCRTPSEAVRYLVAQACDVIRGREA